MDAESSRPTIRWTSAETALGPILLAATDRGICRLSFDEGHDALDKRFPGTRIERDEAGLATLLAKVQSALARPGTAHQLPLDPGGSSFQHSVWRELARIPAGETLSYAELAARAGNPQAVRAAGSACGANPVAVLIPCHRAVRSDGGLGGYAYGLERKRRLLAAEAQPNPAQARHAPLQGQLALGASTP